MMTAKKTMTAMTATTAAARRLALLLPLVTATAAGCAGTKRSPEAYRADTRQVLETRSGQIQRCYDRLLATDAGAGGTVTVRFTVEQKTGAFANVTIDPSGTTAKEPAVRCVLDAPRGLALAPADANEGRAMFSYELRPSAPATPTT